MLQVLSDLEKLSNEKLNGSTEIILDWEWQEGLDIPLHLAINQ
jgi:hypothetical protein